MSFVLSTKPPDSLHLINNNPLQQRSSPWTLRPNYIRSLRGWLRIYYRRLGAHHLSHHTLSAKWFHNLHLHSPHNRFQPLNYSRLVVDGILTSISYTDDVRQAAEKISPTTIPAFPTQEVVRPTQSLDSAPAPMDLCHNPDPPTQTADQTQTAVHLDLDVPVNHNTNVTSRRQRKQLQPTRVTGYPVHDTSLELPPPPPQGV